MIGQQKRSLEHCISLQPAKCLKQFETLKFSNDDDHDDDDDEVLKNVLQLQTQVDDDDRKALAEEPNDVTNEERDGRDNCCSSLESPERIWRAQESSSSVTSPSPCGSLYHYHQQLQPHQQQQQQQQQLLLSVKRVPVGPEYQANIPVWDPEYAAHDVEEEKIWYGSRVWPLHDDDDGGDDDGDGDDDDDGDERMRRRRNGCECECGDSGSVECVRLHVEESRERLAAEIGQAFEGLGFDEMGECVCELWTEEEEKAFREIVKMNPASLGRNFWNRLAFAFPTRSTNELVSYYFNVFVLRRRGLQNRYDPHNIDSDDDEGDLPESDVEDWDHTEEESELGVEDHDDSFEDYDSGDEEDMSLCFDNSIPPAAGAAAAATETVFLHCPRQQQQQPQRPQQQHIQVQQQQRQRQQQQECRERELWMGALEVSEWGRIDKLISTNGMMKEIFGEVGSGRDGSAAAAAAAMATATATATVADVDCRASGSRYLGNFVMEGECS